MEKRSAPEMRDSPKTPTQFRKTLSAKEACVQLLEKIVTQDMKARG